MKHIASLAAIAAIVPMMWFTVKPDGAAFCKSGVSFRPAHAEWESNVQAAKVATSSFCSVVANYPQ